MFLLDDHEIVRRGVRDTLEDAGGIEVVGEAATAAETLRRLPASRPDVAVLDARLPDGSGIDVCREIRSGHPHVGCLILTSYDDTDALFGAVMAGAAGYLLKQIRSAELVDAVLAIAAGKSLLDASLTLEVTDRMRRQAESDPLVAGLGPRERDILRLIAQGMTNREIAKELFLSEKTVKNSVSSMLDKLGLSSRT
nr:response regulator transcription factor [Micromonospora sp. DSM 115978]